MLIHTPTAAAMIPMAAERSLIQGREEELLPESTFVPELVSLCSGPVSSGKVTP
jgi:hypothetical protein